MSSTLERIFNDVDLLPEKEKYDLYANLKARFEPVDAGEESSSEVVDAAWDEEIDYRITALKEGRILPIPGDVADQQMADFISKLRASGIAAL